GDRFAGVAGGGIGRGGLVVIAAGRLRERSARQRERQRRRGDRRAARDRHPDRIRTAGATCKKKSGGFGRERQGSRVSPRPRRRVELGQANRMTAWSSSSS